MRTTIAAVAAWALAAAQVHAGDNALQGEWSRGDGKARVRIAPCGDDLCAVNTWIRPDVTGEKVGDRLVMTVRAAGADTWEGKAFDPQRHMTFRMRIDVGAQAMTTHGCVLGGLLCKTMGWTRL